MAKKKKVDWEPGTYYGSNKYNKAAGLYSGESTKASWVDDEGNITKEKFRADSKEDRKMFRKINRNKRKGKTE